MLINGGPLNLAPLNSLFIGEEGLSEVIVESILMDHNLSESLILKILERLDLSDNLTGPRTTTDNVAEVLSITDSILIGFIIPILESLVISDINNADITKVAEVKELILSLDSTSNLVTFNNTLLEVLDILDTLNYGVSKTITEIVALSDLVSSTLKAVNTIVSTILCSESVDIHSSIFLFNSEELSILDITENKVLFNSLLKDDLIISVGGIEGGEDYISYLLSPETFSISTYSNYDFYGSAKIDGKYLFINKNGLFKYGGDTDDGEDIISRIKTAAMSFGTSNLKQLPNFYMGLSNSNKIVLKVSVDGKADIFYKLNKTSENLETQKIAIGKGLIGRYFQFEIITQQNTQFELESLEFYPLTLKRKL